MNQAIARILLRYVLGLAVGYGLISAELSEALGMDGDVIQAIELGLAVVAAFLVERWYWLKRKLGAH